MKNLMLKTLIGLALLGFGIATYHRSAPQNKLANNLTSVEVLSLVETDQSFELMLRNVSSRSINGYSIAFQTNASRTVDLTVGDRAISPNQEFKVTLPHRKEIFPVSIRYVIFDDGTGEGESTGITELQERRRGRSDQLKRILTLLNRSFSDRDVEKLRTELQSLSEARQGERSIYFVQGQRNAKEDILLSLEKIDKTNLGASLASLARQTSKALERTAPKQ